MRFAAVTALAKKSRWRGKGFVQKGDEPQADNAASGTASTSQKSN